MLTLLITSVLTALTANMMLATSPISMGLIILAMTLTLALFYATALSSWIAFLIFLLYAGGMLVMFSYFVAISPNQQLFNSTYLTVIVTATIMTAMIATNTMTPMLPKLHPLVSTFYLPHNTPMLIMLALLLLLAMIIVVKISTHSKGPLRSFMS